MPKTEARQAIQERVGDLLKSLNGEKSLKNLKDLYSVLNYDCRKTSPLSRRPWRETITQKLADDPVVLATGGDHDDFEVIYARLASDNLFYGHERPIVQQLLRDHPYALFVFSNANQDRWHFLNVKYDDHTNKRQIFRRIAVGPEEQLGNRLRTAYERFVKLDLEEIRRSQGVLSPLSIQQSHDDAFDVEPLNKEFFSTFAKLYHQVADDIAMRRGFEKKAKPLAHVILNRMLFLYFIQKKGWLDNKQDYLYSRFKLHENDLNSHSYYSNILPEFCTEVDRIRDGRGFDRDANSPIGWCKKICSRGTLSTPLGVQCL